MRIEADPTEEKATPKTVVVEEKSLPAFPPPHPTPRQLDITSPLKWQMAVRVYLETLSGPNAEHWLDEFRVMYAVVGRVVRERVNHSTVEICYVCGRPFVDGRPAGEAFYNDGERNAVKVYCHHMSEYPQLLQKALERDQHFRNAEEAEARAARQVMLNFRRPTKAEQ